MQHAQVTVRPRGKPYSNVDSEGSPANHESYPSKEL